MCLGVQIARIPELEKRHHHRHILCALGCPRVFIHRLGASEEARKRGPTKTQRDHEANCRPDRITTTHPVPHREAGIFADTKLGCGSKVGGHSKHVLTNRGLRHSAVDKPGPSTLCVGQCLFGCKGLGTDDKKRGLRIEVARHHIQIVRVHVGYEVGV